MSWPGKELLYPKSEFQVSHLTPTPIYPPTELARVSHKETLSAALHQEAWPSRAEVTGSLPSNQWNSLRAAGQNHQPAWPRWELRGSKMTPGVMKEPLRLPRQPWCFLLCSTPILPVTNGFPKWTLHAKACSRSSEGDPIYTNRRKGTPSNRPHTIPHLPAALCLP